MKTQLQIPEAVEYSGLSRTRIYDALRLKALKARKAGRRTLIAVADLDAYLASLPEYGAEA
jgi:excisionase family DNA binding protein